MILETAPAKINLYLHVGPLRHDGLHELASLFVFAEEGDRIGVAAAPELSLKIEGPFAGALSGLPREKNLVWRAASVLKEKAGIHEGAALLLQKNLPIASGIGGGSADAAAVLRALMKLWRPNISEEALFDLAFELGADVPACLNAAPIYVSGAGEQIKPGPSLPPLWICLVNPGVDMPTGAIFQAFDKACPAPPFPSATMIEVSDNEMLTASLKSTRNDLESIARNQAPEIDDVIGFLGEEPGSLIARMSGSGATCFALFASAAAAAAAARRANAREWWALASPLCLG